MTDPEVPDESGRTDPPEETPGDELPEEEQPGDEDGLEPVEEEAAVAALSEEAGPVPEIDGNRVYANGAAITIRKEDGVCYIFYGTDGEAGASLSRRQNRLRGRQEPRRRRGHQRHAGRRSGERRLWRRLFGRQPFRRRERRRKYRYLREHHREDIRRRLRGGQKRRRQRRVLGTARTENRARGPLPEEGFTKDGHSVYGGGYAYSNSRNRADASVGAVSLKVLEGGATHFVRGGGYATATSAGRRWPT